ncbi:ABC transporter permease subunit, partial [Pseudomonas sp. SIMBA_021]
RSSLLSLDASMVNAARTLGMSMTQSVFKVILPRVVNGIAAGSLLVALYT